MNMHFTAFGFRFIGQIGFLESMAGKFVQIRHFIGREQCPFIFLGHAFHEQVGNPVGCIHVVCAPAFIAGVLAQIEEILDIDMPGFQIGADCPLALATLINRHGRIVGDFQEWHYALRGTVRAFDIGTESAHRCPVVAQATGIFGEQRIVPDSRIDAIQRVGN